jgi:TonB family protein
VLSEVASVGSRDKPDAIELFDPKTDLDRQVVETEEAVDQEKDDKPARFAGEVRNRVKREMQADRRGRFQQGRSRPTVPDASKDGEGGYRGGPFSDLLAIPQSPHALPDDIRKGGQTVLNTDPVLYASFLNRVADEIYDAWTSNASDAMDRVYGAGGKLSANIYVTKLTVVFNREGGVASVKILKSSGVRELDEAPKKAFWDTEPFPNPPGQMFDEDGLVRVVYEFQYEWKSSGFNIIPLI